MTFCKSKSNSWSQVSLTSGCNDAWVNPTSARMLFSQIRAKIQGHRCILDGPNPGLIIGDSGDFIPFVTEEHSQFPMYPTPTSSSRHAGLYPTSMRVLNLDTSRKSAAKAQALIFNPLVSRILLKHLPLTESKEFCCDLKRAGFGKRKSDC